jgi:adenine phosphoribosyltransferase
VSIDAAWLVDFIRDIPDFPTPGIVFKDITPLLGNAKALAAVVDALAEPFVGAHVDKVIGIEARGFIVAGPVAYRLGAGLVPVRKPGKLPHEIERQEYELEYGTDALELHRDGVQPGERVVVVDDVLATVGTAAATVALVERLGGEVIGLAFILELAFLAGRRKLSGRNVEAILRVEAS